LLKLLSAIVLLQSFTACATSGQKTGASEEPVSTIPWSRPESWEATGTLGSFLPAAQSGFYQN